MKRQQKLSSFFRQKRMAVEPEKHKDGLDKDGDKHEIKKVFECFLSHCIQFLNNVSAFYDYN